jgi:hypothetical protein
MNVLQGTIEPEGAIVDVLLGLASSNVQQLRTAGRPVPAPLAARALLDLGADACCVDSSLIAPLVRLGLQQAGYVIANIPAFGSVKPASEYYTNLTLVHPSGAARANFVLRNHLVVEQTLGPLGYQVLIGRDVLDRCLLVYDGLGKRFTVAY